MFLQQLYLVIYVRTILTIRNEYIGQSVLNRFYCTVLRYFSSTSIFFLHSFQIEIFYFVYFLWFFKLETMKAMIEETKEHVAQSSNGVKNPRYARVNTLRWSIDEALQGNLFCFHDTQILLCALI